MGITGLLPFLEEATRTCNISEFRGATMAVDSYCWLHKGASACAEILARGEDSDVYINYCMKYVHMLKKYDIKPIMVFDGNRLPAKELTEKKRRESRKNAKVRALELLRLGKKEEAWNYFRQCVDITPRMAHNLIEECRKINVDCIVAPYESDSQLAYLNLNKLADIVLTEDSDLVLFGCTKVLYKLDLNGNGRLVEKEKIPQCMKMKPDQYNFDKFRYTCILSGCDYLDSLPGIGLKKALKFFQLTAENDPAKFLDKVPRYLNLKCLVTEEYKEGFMVADATFRHQIVFDPVKKKLTHLTDPGLTGTRPEYCRNAGNFFDDKLAYQIAIGNVDPSTHEKYDHWSPSKSSLSSIWSECYVKKPSRKELKELENKNKNAFLKIQKSDFFDKSNEEIDEREKLFKAQLEIYKPQEISETNPDDENDCDEIEKTTSIVEDESPVLSRKKFINPFLKKNRKCDASSDEINENTIVKSKYFHKDFQEKTVEIEEEEDDSERNLDEALKMGDEILQNDDETFSMNNLLDSENIENQYKKRKIEENCDKIENETKKTNMKKNTPRKSRFTKCRPVGLQKSKNQPTLDTLFASMKSKNT